MCKRLKMLFLPTFPSIKRQRIGSISFSNTHHIRLLLPKLTIWWGNTKMVYVPTTYQISPSSCHYYASSYYLCCKSGNINFVNSTFGDYSICWFRKSSNRRFRVFPLDIAQNNVYWLQFLLCIQISIKHKYWKLFAVFVFFDVFHYIFAV